MIRTLAPLIFKHCALLCSLAISTNLLALPEDSEKDIHISSDSASLDRTKGQIIYTGNVKITQGTLIIEADKVTLFRSEQGVERVIANGQPATYEQLLSANEDKTRAYGETIIYEKNLEKLTLLDQAGLRRSDNVFTGQKIVYSIKDQRVQANGQSQENSNGRIQMIIQPNKLPDPKP